MTQKQALAILKTGVNVFLTGEPGAGKTYVINQYIKWLNRCNVSVAITASTGIASTHIGGMTIHSWCGIGVRDTLSKYDLDTIVSREVVVRRVKKAKVLIIDEISMLDGKVLDMVDLVCRTIRQKPEAFGGIQVVLVGDFFQLPPITKSGDVTLYAFEAKSWREANIQACYLNEQHRQEDEIFLGLLKSIRQNDIEESHYTLLSEQKDIGYENIEPTKLYTHNSDVESVNQVELKRLPGKGRVFKMSGKGSKILIESLVRNCLSPEVLELKEEAMVMCTKNNFEEGYVNGTMGRVVGFSYPEGWPIIKTAQGREIKVEPTSWEVIEDGKSKASITQVPLRLAWAITVHKSQGMSLDAAEMDLSKAFAYGQGYVALSRVRSLQGLKVLGLGPNSLIVNPKVVEQDKHFLIESESLVDSFVPISEEEQFSKEKEFVARIGGVWHNGETVDEVNNTAPESTYQITKRMLQEGKSVTEISKVRSMAESTIWNHLEKLTSEGDLDMSDIKHLLATNKSWSDDYFIVLEAIEEYGSEKLKPLYEALDEKYDYDFLRLCRLVYSLEDRNKPSQL